MTFPARDVNFLKSLTVSFTFTVILLVIVIKCVWFEIIINPNICNFFFAGNILRCQLQFLCKSTFKKYQPYQQSEMLCNATRPILLFNKLLPLFLVYTDINHFCQFKNHLLSLRRSWPLHLLPHKTSSSVSIFYFKMVKTYVSRRKYHKL